MSAERIGRRIALRVDRGGRTVEVGLVPRELPD
jgi:hypothetical protein